MDITRLEEKLKASLEDLKTLRDETRVDLHLAGMDARDEWKKVEARLPSVEKLAQEVGKTSREVGERIAEAIKRLRRSGGKAAKR